MTIIWRRIAIAWLALGTLVFVHGAMTGSGLAGLLLYHQLIASHSVSPMIVSELLFFPLCLVPLVILIVTRDPTPAQPQPVPDTPVDLRRTFLLGGLFGGAIALLLRPGRNAHLRLAAFVTLTAGVVCIATATWSFLDRGNPLDNMPLINLDTGQAIPPVREATISGTIRPQLALTYEESSEVKGTSYGRYHRLVPLTSENWRPDRTIRVLVDVDQPNLPPAEKRFIQRGFVLPGVPGYIHRVFADKGVTLDGGVIVLRAAPDIDRASFLLAFGVVALAVGFVLAAANQRAGISRSTR